MPSSVPTTVNRIISFRHLTYCLCTTLTWFSLPWILQYSVARPEKLVREYYKVTIRRHLHIHTSYDTTIYYSAASTALLTLYRFCSAIYSRCSLGEATAYCHCFYRCCCCYCFDCCCTRYFYISFSFSSPVVPLILRTYWLLVAAAAAAVCCSYYVIPCLHFHCAFCFLFPSVL